MSPPVGLSGRASRLRNRTHRVLSAAAPDAPRWPTITVATGPVTATINCSPAARRIPIIEYLTLQHLTAVPMLEALSASAAVRLVVTVQVAVRAGRIAPGPGRDAAPTRLCGQGAAAKRVARSQGRYAREDGAPRLSQEITAINAASQTFTQHLYLVVEHQLLVSLHSGCILTLRASNRSVLPHTRARARPASWKHSVMRRSVSYAPRRARPVYQPCPAGRGTGPVEYWAQPQTPPAPQVQSQQVQ
jgi:hypothetical protein